MIVNKTCWVNPIEPNPMSFRAPVGLETWLNIAFYNQNGSPYNSDLAAQLQLTGKTSARTTTFLVPATDIVNGKARATIPADTLTDPNGYRLRLLGTLAGTPALLAVGSVMPIFSAGLDAVAVDVIDTVELAFEYGENVELDVTVWLDSGKGSIYDLTAEGTSVSANVYDVKGGLALVPFTVTVLAANKIRLSLTAEQVNMLPGTCWWSMIGSSGVGATTLCEGAVTVTGVVIPPLVTTVASYDYQKPVGDADPLNGQIVHSNIAQNMLKVSKLTQPLADLTPTLQLIRAGDNIQIGVTLWSVVSATERVSWFDFLISPVQQAAVTGVNDVTFSRPLI